MPAISNLFSYFGPLAKIKLVALSSGELTSQDWLKQFRSLNIEHVSLAGLMQQEISRHTPLGHAVERANRTGQPVSEDTILAIFRRWFWARKPDAGFAVTGFPATLLQAKVFDEWLEARDESLDGVLALAKSSNEPVLEHYRTLGLVQDAQLVAL